MCADVNQLFSYIQSAITFIMGYISDSTLYTNHLSKEQYENFKDNFKCIFNMGESLDKYKLKNCDKHLQRMIYAANCANEFRRILAENNKKNGN